MDNDSRRDAAVSALVEDGGSEASRSEQLVDAVAEVAAEEGLELISRQLPTLGSATDQRVSRLHRVLEKLGEEAAMPTAFEIGVLYRITQAQARAVLRTFEARYSKEFRSRMSAAVKRSKASKVRVDGVEVWRLDFDDPAVLNLAADLLRRRGLRKSLDVDGIALHLDVPRAAKDDLGNDAVAILGCKT